MYDLVRLTIEAKRLLALGQKHIRETTGLKAPKARLIEVALRAWLVGLGVQVDTPADELNETD